MTMITLETLNVLDHLVAGLVKGAKVSSLSGQHPTQNSELCTSH